MSTTYSLWCDACNKDFNGSPKAGAINIDLVGTSIQLKDTPQECDEEARAKGWLVTDADGKGSLHSAFCPEHRGLK